MAPWPKLRTASVLLKFWPVFEGVCIIYSTSFKGVMQKKRGTHAKLAFISIEIERELYELLIFSRG